MNPIPIVIWALFALFALALVGEGVPANDAAGAIFTMLVVAWLGWRKNGVVG